MICPVCKTENDGDAKFCKNCGNELVKPEPAEVPEMSFVAYEDYKPNRSAKSWLISLAWPAVVILIFLFSYIYVMVNP